MSAQLTDIFRFDGANGNGPVAGLTIDTSGNLFGTTVRGGTDNAGTVFEISNTGTAASPSYASAPATLVSFDGSDGGAPASELTADANGDLFGTTQKGGTTGDGTVFELKNNGSPAAPNYASAPTTVVSFDGGDGQTPVAGLTANAHGDLFGTTFQGGTDNAGTVFEVKNTGTATAPNYASAPTTLVNFDGDDGDALFAGLTVDASGDLFGTTEAGGVNDDGTVYELKNNGSPAAPNYASAPTTVVSFDGGDGQTPVAGLTADAHGDLFGTTSQGGTDNAGTVFELKNNGSPAAPNYASLPSTLVSFDGTAFDHPRARVILDSHGNLFGTTFNGGPDNLGTAFEIQNTGSVAAPVYSSVPISLANFDGPNGQFPAADLTEDVNGNLLGTTQFGGVGDNGAVFSISGATTTNFSAQDTTTNTPFQTNGTPYSGPVAGLQWEDIDTTTDNLNVTANVPDVFIHTGSGEDAINVSHANGNNVLDGSTGSNFLVGGSGDDTFFVDDRGPSADIWSTVSNFHAGDSATIFGITQSGFDTSWVDGQGATGFAGLTLHVTAAGHPTASLTLAGFSTADMSDGRISTSFGHEADGTPYLFVHANS